MTNKVLVTGATGLIGLATVERFLDAGWDVVAVSRRQPKLPSGRSVTALSVDLRDKSATADALGSIDGITHIAYNAVYERPDLVSGWSGDDYREVNNAMLRNTVEPVLANAGNFQHISIQQGTKYYGVHLHPIPIPARESDPRDAHENFFHDQEDYVAQMGAKRGFRYTALRPQLVTGSTPGTLNVLPAIGAYGAIRRELGEPFGFPGGPSFVWEAADADLVADVMVWSAESPNAANQAFNVTNGDVFEWRSVWPAIAAALGVQAASDTPLSLAEYLSDKGEVWRRLAERHGLRYSDLHILTGYGDQHADFAFAYGAPAGPRAFVSTVKLRQAGYTKVIDTQQAFSAALKSLIDQKYLPPASVHVEQLVGDGSRRGN
jgi:nucleoside-diphosphate-sugar epimerase